MNITLDKRRKSTVIQIGNTKIGNGHPVAIQSMCNTKTEDLAATVAQIIALQQEGCDIIRVAIPTKEAALNIPKIQSKN